MHWVLDDVWSLDIDYYAELLDLIKSGDIKPFSL